MKRLTITLAASFAALAVSAGTAFGASPVQSATQSSSTDQAALAASSATQVQPSNENISVRVLSPGSDGDVTQSNDAASSANAANTASTTQNASQALASGCGCAVPGITSGRLDSILPGAMQAAGTDAAAAPAAAPAPAPTGSTQANDAASSGTAANTAPTSQAATQSASGGSGVQSSQQDASTQQAAVAASSATQVHPENSNISVRVLSPGNDGAVSQSNDASSSANAANTAATTQGSSQTGSGSGVQSSTQNADTSQESAALSSATQVHPENSNLSVRVLSPGNDGAVSQSNKAASSAGATNTAPVAQTSTQNGTTGSSCGCQSTSPAVQAIGQSSSVEQAAIAASSANQFGASNSNEPIRIASGGGGGSLSQENQAASSASAANTAPVSQTGAQTQSGSRCGCSTGPAVQALGQSSEIGQLAVGLSSATQIGASNESAPIRIGSYGNDGWVSQENEAASSANATNTAPVTQTGTQTQSGSGVQALGQDSSIGQLAFAASAAKQLPGESRCGCGGGSFGNSAGPIRIASDGSDGALHQENEAASSAGAANTAAPTQTGTQTQSSACGCQGLGVQALGQWSGVDQLAAALSSAKQIGASNSSEPIRIWSDGGGGTTRQTNGAASSGTAPNVARSLQTGTQLMV
jgi:trimeric autotransporter adhesin